VSKEVGDTEEERGIGTGGCKCVDRRSDVVLVPPYRNVCLLL